jgi:hypothetical protein
LRREPASNQEITMPNQDTGRRPEQQSGGATQRQPEQQNKQRHHDPRGHGGEGGGLAGQSPKGGASQDGFGQSGVQGTPAQTERNARPGADD